MFGNDALAMMLLCINDALAMMLLCINDALALAAIILQYYSLSGILGQKDCLAECSFKSKTICKYANKM